MKVLVVGASGFIGRQVLARLREAGIDVVAGQRRLPTLASGGIEYRRVEAGDAASFLAATKDVTHALNCVMSCTEVMLDVTSNLMAAAKAGSLARVVHFSSVAVYGEAAGKVDEASPQSALDWYGKAKIACEQVVGASPVESVILRPAMVGGGGSDLWSARIAKLLWAKRLGDLGSFGDGFCNFIHARDVAYVAIAALSAAGVAGRAFNLACSEPPRWNRYLMTLARALGAIPVESIPSARIKLEKLVAPALNVLELAGTRFGFGNAPPSLSPGLLRFFPLRAIYDSASTEMILSGQRATLDQIELESADFLLKSSEK